MVWLLFVASASAQANPDAAKSQQTSAANSADAKPARPATPTASARAHTWWLGAEGHASFLSNLVDQSTINLAFGYSAKGGYRWNRRAGVYFQAEQDFWTQTEITVDVQQGVFNIGLGVDYLYFAERMRFAAGLGTSTLLFTTALDDKGTTGLYIDTRPAGLRWPMNHGFTIVFDPLCFTLLIPALSGIPLVQIQYRTALSFEYDLGA